MTMNMYKYTYFWCIIFLFFLLLSKLFLMDEYSIQMDPKERNRRRTKPGSSKQLGVWSFQTGWVTGWTGGPIWIISFQLLWRFISVGGTDCNGNGSLLVVYTGTTLDWFFYDGNECAVRACARFHWTHLHLSTWPERSAPSAHSVYVPPVPNKSDNVSSLNANFGQWFVGLHFVADLYCLLRVSLDGLINIFGSVTFAVSTSTIEFLWAFFFDNFTSFGETF